MSDNLYDTDFVRWTERQADALRRAAGEGSNLPVDWDNLAEEVESLGRSERREVRSLVRTIVAHLLKLAYSPSVETRVGWESEISHHRTLLQEALKDSPSLRPSLGEVVAEETPRAVRLAAQSLRKYREYEAATAVASLEPTMTADQVLDDDWFVPGTRFERAPVGEGG